MSFSIMLTILLAFSAPHPGAGAAVPLEWEVVDGAVAYMVDVQTADGRSVVSRRVEETRMTVTLGEGSYRIRIGVFNRFDKLEVSTDWVPLNVEKPRMPFPWELSVKQAARASGWKGTSLGKGPFGRCQGFSEKRWHRHRRGNCVTGGEGITFDISTGDARLENTHCWWKTREDCPPGRLINFV
jgi:hypothetical protein